MHTYLVRKLLTSLHRQARGYTDNLQLPCVQPPTSSYNFQFAIFMVVVVIVDRGGRGEHCGQDRTGQDRTGQDRQN